MPSCQKLEHARRKCKQWMSMKTTNRTYSLCSLLLYIAQMAPQVAAGTQFASHVSVNTPARSYSHGVGDPVHLLERRAYQRQQRPVARSLQRPMPPSLGYPRMRPIIPFNVEEVPHNHPETVLPWQYNSYQDISIPVLPPSPYKVDSSDPESLWPEGLYLPAVPAPRFPPTYGRRSDTGEVTSESDPMDPYLLEGTEAIEAVERASLHGLYFFHDIPHIKSLHANRDKRIANELEPHRLGSIRHTWPYNRP